MKKLILALVLFMLAVAAPGKGLERIRDFGDDPGRLRMFIHRPANADRTGHQMLIDPGPSLQEGGRSCIYSKDIDFYLPGWIMDFFGLTGSQISGRRNTLLYIHL
jgi:hypothetical protein